MKEVAQRIKLLRESIKIPQVKLAELAGSTLGWLICVLRGQIV